MFKKYVRTNIAEMRDLEKDENKTTLLHQNISISKEDLSLDDVDFMQGKIARNPKNHKDQ